MSNDLMSPGARLNQLCDDWGISPQALAQAGRTGAHMKALACYILRKSYPDLPAAQIAPLVGLSDHTTVLYHVKKLEQQAMADPELAQKLDKACNARYRTSWQLVVKVRPEAEQVAL